MGGAEGIVVAFTSVSGHQSVGDGKTTGVASSPASCARVPIIMPNLNQLLRWQPNYPHENTSGRNDPNMLATIKPQ